MVKKDIEIQPGFKPGSSEFFHHQITLQIKHPFTICLRLAKTLCIQSVFASLRLFSRRRNVSDQPLRGSDGTCKVSADT